MNYGSGAFVGLGLCCEIIIFRRRRRDRQYVFEGCNNSIMCYGDGHKYLYFSLFISIHSCICGSLHKLLPGTQFSLLRLLRSPCFTAPVSPPHPVCPGSGCPAAHSSLLSAPCPGAAVAGGGFSFQEGDGTGLLLVLFDQQNQTRQPAMEPVTHIHCSAHVSSTAASPYPHLGSAPPKIGFLDADGLLKSVQNQKVVACTDLPGGLAAWRTRRDSELMSVITA